MGEIGAQDCQYSFWRKIYVVVMRSGNHTLISNLDIKSVFSLNLLFLRFLGSSDEVRNDDQKPHEIKPPRESNKQTLSKG